MFFLALYLSYLTVRICSLCSHGLFACHFACHKLYDLFFLRPRKWHTTPILVKISSPRLSQEKHLPTSLFWPSVTIPTCFFYIFYIVHSPYCSPLAILFSLYLCPLAINFSFLFSSSLGWHSQGERMFPLGLILPFPGPYLFFFLF